MNASKPSWFPCAATALTLISCYGTLILTGLLSFLGISLALNAEIWTGAIVGSAALAFVAIAVSGWNRRTAGPTLVAAVGLGLILWAMLGAYDAIVEAVGFAFLVGATVWDWRAGKGLAGAGNESDISWTEADALAGRLAGEPRPIIVDVRGPDEFDGTSGHIRHARNIPVADLARRLPELAEFKGRELTLVCRTQLRSAKAAHLLRDAGFLDVRVLRGGMARWNELGLPAERSEQQPRI